MRHKTSDIQFNIIIVPDKETNQYSAFFAQFPHAIAVADTEQDAIKNLIPLVNVMLSDQKEEILRGLDKEFDYSEKSVNAQFTI